MSTIIRMKHSSFLLFVLLLTLGCNEVPTSIPEISDECLDKVLLIEEMTGVSCSNCPKGTAVLNDILALYPNNVIAYAIHGSFLAEPLSESKYDFRYEKSVEMENYLGDRSKPAAVIDRFPFDDLTNGNIKEISINNWINKVESRCQTPKSIDMTMTTDYDVGTRTVNITISTKGVRPIEAEIRMNVVITESHLIDPQDAGSQVGIISDYEHNHVMKDRLSNLTGDFLITGLSVDQEISKTYSYTVPEMINEEWNPDNMEVIAFVSEGGQNRGPVLQAVQEQLN